MEMNQRIMLLETAIESDDLDNIKMAAQMVIDEFWRMPVS